MKFSHLAVAGAVALFSVPAEAHAGGLRGSPSSMKEQHKVAKDRDLEFIDDAAQVRELVASGGLDLVTSTGDYVLSGVSFPYALPEVKLFLERLGKQYREANGSRLVVTSLTRPIESQPRNAHELSVHPTGMAVDFRVPANAKARGWLESALLQLENRGVLDVTRERFPPHYHVAIFPAAYASHAAKQVEAAPQVPKPVLTAAPAPQVMIPVVSQAEYPASNSRNPALLLFAIGTGGVVILGFFARRRAAA